MSIIIKSGSGAELQSVGAVAAVPAHVTTKPIPYGALGHYVTTHRCTMAASQDATSRLWEVRNTHATNLIIPILLRLRIVQTLNYTASVLTSIDTFKVTGFTAVDTTNTVTPTATVKRASMASAPGGAAIRGVTVAGASAGMTGGTLVKAGDAVDQLSVWIIQTVTVSIYNTHHDRIVTAVGLTDGNHPFALAQNEGLIVENRVDTGAAGTSDLCIAFEWCEVAAF